MANLTLRQPVLLYEAVEAVYAYINNINYDEKKNNLLLKYGKKYTMDEKRKLIEKFDTLSDIIKEACFELDKSDPRLAYYFKQLESDNKRQSMCLAKVLAYSFLDISISDVEDSIEYIHKMADSTLTQRIEITNINSGGLSIRLLEDDEANIDYIDQLDKLELEDETKWNIYKILLRFKDYFDEMISLIWSVFPRLSKALNKIMPLIQSTYDYWDGYFQDHSFFSFLDHIAKQSIPEDSLDMVINLSVIACTDMIYTYDVLIGKDYRQVYIGILIDEDFHIDKIQLTNDSICNILKIISDRSKFEILRRISNTSAYGQELANEMNLTTATISRHMSMLQDYGLVHTRRGEMRIYYSLNKEAIGNLFDMARSALLE